MAAYLSACEPHEFAQPLWVQGELYRANDIAAEDTNCLRAEMETGVTICYHSTLCATTNHPRSWTIIGEKGTARLDDTDGATVLGEPIPIVEREHTTTMLFRRLIEVIQGSDEALFMPLADAESHLLMSNGAYESSGTIHAIPAKYLREEQTHDGRVATVLDGIDRAMLDAAQEGKLLSESGIPWAVPTKPFDLNNYKDFPQRWHD
jgi:predicted dehydrogenase